VQRHRLYRIPDEEDDFMVASPTRQTHPPAHGRRTSTGGLLLLATTTIVLIHAWLLAGQAAATEYYLRRTAIDVLLPIPPEATTAPFKDSPALTRTTYREIGTWSAAASGSSLQLSGLADLRVWVGLKNSDDQGTYFDLRAEVLKGGVVIASGEVKAIQGVTRNPDKAKEVVVPFGPIADGNVQAGEVLSLRIVTKVADSGGHSNTVGLRLYYDGVTRPSRFGSTLATVGRPEIRFTSPVSGSVVRDPALVVEGEITAPTPGVAAVSLSMAMTLEGQAFDWPIPVAVNGGRFAARVGLIPGSTELLARVTDAEGQSAEATLLLTFEPDPPEYDTAPEPDVHPRSGFAPLAVTFGAEQAADPTVTVVDLDTDGDGQPEFTLTDFAVPPHRIVYTYPTEGLYVATLVVQDQTGQSRTTRVPIHVIPLPDLAVIWDSFRAALSRGDVDGALRWIAAEARERYGRVLTDLQADLSSIGAALGTLEIHVVSPEYATASVPHTGPAAVTTYLVTFVRDDDGVWRIASL
jgi:hypothetical protein